MQGEGLLWTGPKVWVGGPRHAFPPPIGGGNSVEHWRGCTIQLLRVPDSLQELEGLQCCFSRGPNPVSIGHPPRTPTSGLRSWMNKFTGVFVLHLPRMVLAQTSMPKTLIRNLLVSAEHARKFERITHNIARACSL